MLIYRHEGLDYKLQEQNSLILQVSMYDMKLICNKDYMEHNGKNVHMYQFPRDYCTFIKNYGIQKLVDMKLFELITIGN